MYNVFQLAYSTETLKKIPLKIKHQRIFFKIRPLKILKKQKNTKKIATTQHSNFFFSF